LVVTSNHSQNSINFIYDSTKEHLELSDKISGNFTVAKHIAREFKLWNLVGHPSSHEESCVDTWIEFASSEIQIAQTMEDADKVYQFIDYKLQNRTFLASTQPSLADFAVYESLKNSKIFKGYAARFGSFVPHLIRFFNFLDKKENIKKAVDELSDAVKKKSSTKEILEINQNKEKVDPELQEVIEAMKDINLPNAKVG